MSELREATETKGTILERVAWAADGVFIFGDAQDRKIAEQIVGALKSRPIAKGVLLRSCLTVIQKLLPSDLKSELRQKVFAKAPFEIPQTSGYRVLEKLGFGGVNSVYLLKSGVSGSSYAVGMRRISFGDQKSALGYASRQQRQYEHIKRLYSQVPELVVSENHIVFSDHKNRPSVLFIREFVPGPLRDIFQIGERELSRIVSENQTFNYQLTKFVEISTGNEKFVVSEQLDLLGENNLGVVGEKGKERLILLDPHTTDSGKTENRSVQIKIRLNYLAAFVERGGGAKQNLPQ